MPRIDRDRLRDSFSHMDGATLLGFLWRLSDDLTDEQIAHAVRDYLHPPMTEAPPTPIVEEVERFAERVLDRSCYDEHVDMGRYDSSSSRGTRVFLAEQSRLWDRLLDAESRDGECASLIHAFERLIELLEPVVGGATKPLISLYDDQGVEGFGLPSDRIIAAYGRLLERVTDPTSFAMKIFAAVRIRGPIVREPDVFSTWPTAHRAAADALLTGDGRSSGGAG